MIPATRLLRKLKQLTADLAYESRIEATKVGKLTCKPGCAFCCYPKILTAAWDGLTIYLYLKATGRWTPEFRERLVAADIMMTKFTHDSWLGQKVPCVFLDQEVSGPMGEGMCSIYEVRPVGCLSTFSVTPDPRDCARVDGHNVICVMQPSRPEGVKANLAYATLYKEIMAEYIQYPKIATMPGAVLIGEAIAEKLPLPDSVRTVLLGRDAEKKFDEAAEEIL
jgi:Fe-S-cluster containining protein